ncbi:MAG: phage holin family protein [Synergistaceae bacterium]|nr:phage holin family protein [Synergistaceae bacterium]
MDEAADVTVGGIIGLFAWFFGGLDGYFNVLLSFIVVDFILGFMDNLIHNKIKISDFISEFGKKITILLIVGVCHILDKYLLGDTSAIRIGITIYYAISEFTGILKHAHNLGVQVPNFLMTKIKEIQKQFFGKEEEKGKEKKPEEQILDDYFDIREYINFEDAQEAEKIEKIDKIEKAELNKDFIENLTGVYFNDFDF